MRLFGFSATKKNAIPFTSFQKIYVDENRKTWQAVYMYDAIEIEPIWRNCKDLKVNQPVTFSIATANEPVSILVNSEIIGYLNRQKRMLRDYMAKNEALVRAQISTLSHKTVALQIYYYRSQALLEKQKADYEAEKAAYIRKPSIIQDVKLVANKSSSMQYEISCAAIGSELDVEQDNEDRYLVSTKDSYYYLGYLPKQSAAKIEDLESDGYSCRGILLDILDNESDKKDVVVKLIFEDTTFL